jgi:hypothetical protein
MRLIGNYYSEWSDTRGNTRHTLLVTLVACAVGATASAAVIFSLASSPTTQPDVPSISPIVRDVRPSEVQTAQGGPVVKPTPSPQAIVRNASASDAPKTARDGPVEPTPRPVTSMASGRDESVTQTEAEHQQKRKASNRESMAEL